MQSTFQGFFPNLGENPLILFLPRPGCGKSLKPVLWMFMESSICKTYVFVSFLFYLLFFFNSNHSYQDIFYYQGIDLE